MNKATQADLKRKIQLIKYKKDKLEELKKRKQAIESGDRYELRDSSYSYVIFETYENSNMMQIDFGAGYEGDEFKLDEDGLNELIFFLQQAKKRIESSK